MKIPYFHVNAFTGPHFTGNPAGVCLLKDWLADSLLQYIAAENNLSETAFIVRRQGYWDLRWFTPNMEIDLCGHATLAPAFVLISCLGEAKDAVCFQSKSGLLTVTTEDDLLILDFPSRPAEICAGPGALAVGLGRQPRETLKSRDYLAVFDHEEEVRSLRPNMAVLERLDCLGIIATAPGSQSDFVSRFFAPRAGVPEDPVTGSAHCTLIPYWARRLHRTRLHAIQMSQRGGELFCEDRKERVQIGGKAKLYLQGHIELGDIPGANDHRSDPRRPNSVSNRTAFDAR